LKLKLPKKEKLKIEKIFDYVQNVICKIKVPERRGLAEQVEQVEQRIMKIKREPCFRKDGRTKGTVWREPHPHKLHEIQVYLQI
jgi:hypothetical protein